MEQQLWFTAILNSALGGPVTALLEAIGVQPHDPAHPITNAFAMQIVVVVILMVLFGWLRTRLSVDRPGIIQQSMEVVVDGLGGQCEEIIGHGSRRFLGLVFTLGIFIFLSNVLGIIPGLETPTDQITVTVGCALVTFLYYNLAGLKHHGGVRYGLSFTSPAPSMVHEMMHGKGITLGGLLVLVPVLLLGLLMFLIEIVSHLARVLSLSVRLMANMLAGHNITLIFFGLVPLAAPVVFEGLHIFVGLIQAYIFVLLTMVYLAGAVAEEH